MNPKQQRDAGLESFFRLEFYKKKNYWKLTTEKKLNGEGKPASKNNNGVCKEAFATKSDHLQITDDSKKSPRSRRRNHRSNSKSCTKNGYQISNPVSNNMTESFRKPSQVLKVEQKPSDDSSGGFCPDLPIETSVFVNQTYYESNLEVHTNTLTPHQLGENDDATLEPLPLLPNDAVIDESFKEYRCGTNEWNCHNNYNNWKEGLHTDYVQNSLEDSFEEFYRGAHVAPHSTEEDLFRRSSSDDEVDEYKMTSQDLEAAMRRHIEGLRRTLRELLLRDEVARVSMIKKQCTAVDYPMQYRDCDLLPTRDVTQPAADSPTELTLDAFVAGSYNVGHVAD